MYEAIVAVRNSTLDPVRRVIAEEYAYYTVPETQEVSASIGYIANYTNVCERTVRAVTKELCDIGFLEKVGVNKKFGNVVYRVHYDTLPKREPYKYNLRGRPPKVYDGSAEKTPAPNAPVYLETPAPNAPVANKTPANGAYITEYTLKSKQEGDNYVISTELEKLSSVTPLESVSPVMVSGSDVVKQHEAGALHNTASPVAQVFAEIHPEPTPPVTVKPKPKKAANAKATLPPKQPKEPRTLTYDELALLKRVDALEPGLTEQVEERIRKYPRSQPWSVAQVYLLTGIRIAKTLWPTVTSLNGVAFEEEKLLTCYKAWLAMGYNPHGLNWLLDWYKAGGPPQYGKYTQQPAPAPVVVKSDAELEAENDKHNAEVLAFHEWLVSTGRDTRTGYNAITRAGAAVSNVDLPYYDQEKLWYAEYQAEQ